MKTVIDVKNGISIKNVIVGIDFSKGSCNAMRNAISIVSKYNAKLTLLFVVSPDAKTLVGGDEVNKANIVSFVEKKIKPLVDDCRKFLPGEQVQYKIRIGKPAKEINAEAKEQGNALIVLGTHGCSGFEEFFIGSSAYRTICASSCPVLTVRNETDVHRDLTDILVVVDDTMETLQKLKLTASMALKFHAKIHIMGLYPAKYPEIRKTIEAYVRQAELYLLKNNIRLESIYIRNTKKVETVLEYAVKKDVNLIAIMKEVELAGENVFILAPFSERIVNRSPIPILTIDVDKTIYPK
jgi:nucleotide-binding universal stress UspA family protein